MMNWIRKSQPPLSFWRTCATLRGIKCRRNSKMKGTLRALCVLIPNASTFRTLVLVSTCSRARLMTLLSSSRGSNWSSLEHVRQRDAQLSSSTPMILACTKGAACSLDRVKIRRGQTLTGVDVGLAISARLEEGLGQRRPFTHWDRDALPDYAWNDWGKAQTDRVLDLMDIDYLRLAQLDIDSMHKTLVWNLSQKD